MLAGFITVILSNSPVMGIFSLLFFGLFSVPTGVISSVLYMKYIKSTGLVAYMMQNCNGELISDTDSEKNDHI